MLPFLFKFPSSLVKRPPYNLIFSRIFNAKSNHWKLKAYKDECDYNRDGFSGYVDGSWKSSNVAQVAACFRFYDGVLMYWSKRSVVEITNNKCELAAARFGFHIANLFGLEHTVLYTDSQHAQKRLQQPITIKHLPQAKNGVADSLAHYKNQYEDDASDILIRQMIHRYGEIKSSSVTRTPSIFIPEMKVTDMTEDSMKFYKFVEAKLSRDTFDDLLLPVLRDDFRCHSRNVACLHGVGYDRSGLSLMMELAKGSLKDLKPHLKKDQVACISREVLHGLISLKEERGVTYVNVTPTNILKIDAHYKITDFGIIGMISQSYRVLKVAGGCNIDSMIYMSPERLAGGFYEFSSHIWSVGILALEIAGANPFVGCTTYREIRHVQTTLPHSLAQDCRFTTLSPEFRDFVSLCLKKEPDKRATALELLEHPFLRESG